MTKVGSDASASSTPLSGGTISAIPYAVASVTVAPGQVLSLLSYPGTTVGDWTHKDIGVFTFAAWIQIPSNYDGTKHTLFEFGNQTGYDGRIIVQGTSVSIDFSGESIPVNLVICLDSQEVQSDNPTIWDNGAVQVLETGAGFLQFNSTVGVSKDGNTVYSKPNSKWVKSGTWGKTVLPFSGTIGCCSRDGTYVGYISSDNLVHLWSQAGGIVNLPSATNYSYEINCISSDGTTVYGSASITNVFPVKWQKIGTAWSATVLPAISGSPESRVTACSDDGTIAVGWSRDPALGGAGRACIWDSSGNLTLVSLPGYGWTFTGCSADGLTRCGTRTITAPTAPYPVSVAFRWKNGTTTDLLPPSGDNQSVGYSCSSDGGTVVGQAYQYTGGLQSIMRAVYWDANNTVTALGTTNVNLEAVKCST